MLNFFKNVFKKGELRRRIIFTLGMLFVFRLGAAITIPSINADAITASAANSGILGITVSYTHLTLPTTSRE